MMAVIDAIERQYIPNLQAVHPLVGKAQCSINMIRGGSLVNVIPASCEIRLDRRTVPGENGAEVLPAVEAILDALRHRHPGLEVCQQQPDIKLALAPDANQEFSRCVGRVLESLGLSGDACGARYGTHASNFAAAGLAAIVLGPGNIARAHGPDECVAIDDLQRGVAVYRRLMCQPAESWA